LNQQIIDLRDQALAGLKDVASLEELNNWRVRYLGKKSGLMAVLKSLGEMPVEDRKAAGGQANLLKKELEVLLKEKEEALSALSSCSTGGKTVDITLPGRPANLGKLHPMTLVLHELGEIFTSMGFEIVEGPEVEWDYYNFEALIFPGNTRPGIRCRPSG